MSEARFQTLTSLIPYCYSVSTLELDSSDPWRFVRPFINAFNKHWNEVYFPSWLLSADKLMCMRTPDEGDGAHDIPFSSFIPRKPKPKGCELKTVCDAESGVLLRVEIALDFKRQRKEPLRTPPFADEFGLTAAQCLRLTEPGTTRVAYLALTPTL